MLMGATIGAIIVLLVADVSDKKASTEARIFTLESQEMIKARQFQRECLDKLGRYSIALTENAVVITCKGAKK